MSYFIVPLAVIKPIGGYAAGNVQLLIAVTHFYIVTAWRIQYRQKGIIAEGKVVSAQIFQRNYQIRRHAF